jgi:hypothetical protein
MKCTLHKLLEDIDEGHAWTFHGYQEDIKSNLAVKAAAKVAHRATAFWVGDFLSRADKFQIIPELFRLPYEVCWFEGDLIDEDGIRCAVGALCFEANGGIISLIFVMFPGVSHWTLAGHGKVMVPLPGSTNFRVFSHNAANGGETEREFVPFVMRSIGGFLSAINCCNVTRVKIAVDPKLQKARTKRGRLPLFEFWTLQLVSHQTDQLSLGGSHSSPRVHLRRGHPRSISGGKYCWVRACVVGDKSSGVVHKEYATA